MATDGRHQNVSRRAVVKAGGVMAMLSAVGCDALSTQPDEAGSEQEQSGEDGRENPRFAEQVKTGELARLEQRLPDNPLVVSPYGEPGQYGGELRNGLLGANVNPYVYPLTQYDNLVRWAEEWTGATGTEEVLPNVAAEFGANDDWTQFTFQLRRGMKWSDGKPFTADDVVFAFDDVLLDKKIYPVPPSVVTAGEENQPGSIEKLDDYSFKVTFPVSKILFLKQLATYDGRLFTVLPRHYLSEFHQKYNPDVDQLAAESDADDWAQLFASKCGPGEMGFNPDMPVLAAWKLTSAFATGDQQVVVEANPYYWKVDDDGRQLPYIDRVVWEQANSLEVLLLKTVSGEYNFEAGPDTRYTTLANKPVLARGREEGDFRFVPVTDSRMNDMILYLNLTHSDPVKREIAQNRDFRIGLSHALNRQEMIDAALQGQGEAYQVAPVPTSTYYDEEFATQYLEHDVDKANEYLDRAFPQKNADGLRLGPDGQPIQFSLTFVGQYRASWPPMVELVQGYWREVGVDVQPRSVSAELEQEMELSNRFEVSVWHGEGGVDPALVVANYCPISTSSNWASQWGVWYESNGAEGMEPPDSVQEQLSLYRQSQDVADPGEQERLIKEVLRIAKEEFFVIGTVRVTDKYFIAANNIQNLPEPMIQGWAYPSPGPARPEQFFVAEDG